MGANTVNLYQITYTCLDAWINQQQTVTKYQEVRAESESQAIEWFEEHVQMDFDDIEFVEATA